MAILVLVNILCILIAYESPLITVREVVIVINKCVMI
jgi:hypothetical protein